MKNLLIKTIGVISFVLITANKVYAQNLGIPKIPNPTPYNSLEDVINALAQLIRPVFILTFGALILYAAWVWMTAQGDDGKIATARKIIVGAIVGFVIAVFAVPIANLVLDILGVQGITL